MFAVVLGLPLQGMTKNDSSSRLYHGSPYLSKLESISSSAVRAADKVGASLIVVYTHTGEVCWFSGVAATSLGKIVPYLQPCSPEG
jgi:hypothetical protein